MLNIIPLGLLDASGNSLTEVIFDLFALVLLVSLAKDIKLYSEENVVKFGVFKISS